MRAYIYEPRGWEPTSRAAASLRQGMDAIGIRWANGPWREPTPDDADFVVHFGWIKKWLDRFPNYAYPRNDRIREARERGVPVLCVERGCIAPLGRDKWHLMAWNGLNGRGRWLSGAPGDRWDRVFARQVAVKPWVDRPDGPVVLLGQVPRDASLDSCEDYQAWLDKMAADHAKWLFRPHPKAPDVRAGSLNLAPGDTFADVLEYARATAAWNSTCGVESVLAGVPHWEHDDGSMVRHMPPNHWGRRARLREIAYAQWLDEEIQSGEALEHLLPVVGLAVPA